MIIALKSEEGRSFNTIGNGRGLQVVSPPQFNTLSVTNFHGVPNSTPTAPHPRICLESLSKFDQPLNALESSVRQFPT